MKKLLILLFVFLVIFMLGGTSTYAQQFNVNNSISETYSSVNSNVYDIGNNLSIKGKIFGDLICLGDNIDINVVITGDILCAGSNIKISGVIDGNVRVIADQLKLSSVIITRNLSILTQYTQILGNTTIGEDVNGLSQQLDLFGNVKRDVDLVASVINIESGSSILHDLNLTSSNINILKNVLIGGSMYYNSSVNANIFDRKDIHGSIYFSKITSSGFSFVSFAKSLIIYFVQLLISVFIFRYLFEKFSSKTVLKLQSSPAKSMLIGLGVLIVAPVVCLILALSIIGLPVALLVGFIYCLFLLFSSCLLILFLSKKAVEFIPFEMPEHYEPFVIALVTLVAGIIFSLGALGIYAHFVFILFGFGALVLTALDTIRDR